MANIARLSEVIEPEVKALGFDLVRVRFWRGGEIGRIAGDEDFTLQIMAERPETGQLLIDDCAALSHRISDALDALEEAGEVLIREPYRLEVSSPGIDRPLTRPRDFAAWAGHEAKVTLEEPVDGNRTTLQGTLIGIEGETITLDDRKSGRVEFAFDNVRSARLVLTDKLLAATRPLDASGVDEELIEELPEDPYEEQED